MMQHTQMLLRLRLGAGVLPVPRALPLAQGHRFASPGRLTWCRGLPLPQRVSQPLGTDISRVGVSISPCEAILPCMKMHKYSWVRASDSDSISITAGICATTGAARGVGKHQQPGRGFY